MTSLGDKLLELLGQNDGMYALLRRGGYIEQSTLQITSQTHGGCPADLGVEHNILLCLGVLAIGEDVQRRGFEAQPPAVVVTLFQRDVPA